MTINCPNCGKPLKGRQNEKLICYTCGTITDEVETIQIGLGKYKFMEDPIDYIIAFESNKDLKEFKNLALKNRDEYKYCKIVTPVGTEIII